MPIGHRLPPRTIRRGGYEYELTANSVWTATLDELRERHVERLYPPPDMRGTNEPLKLIHLIQLHRIHTCPTEVHYSEHFGVQCGILNAPGLHLPQIRVLWRRGLLARKPPPNGRKKHNWGDIVIAVLHETALPLLNEHRLNEERLRWRAVTELCEQLDKEWAAFREAKYMGEGPRRKPTIAMISERMAEIQARLP